MLLVLGNCFGKDVGGYRVTNMEKRKEKTTHRVYRSLMVS